MWGFVGKLEKVEAASPDEKELHRCARARWLALLSVGLWWAAGKAALTGVAVASYCKVALSGWQGELHKVNNCCCKMKAPCKPPAGYPSSRTYTST